MFKDLEKKAATIKVIDRLHNMRTISYMPVKKQKLIAIETLQFYIPLAKYASMLFVAQELQAIIAKILYF